MRPCNLGCVNIHSKRTTQLTYEILTNIKNIWRRRLQNSFRLTVQHTWYSKIKWYIHFPRVCNFGILFKYKLRKISMQSYTKFSILYKILMFSNSYSRPIESEKHENYTVRILLRQHYFPITPVLFTIVKIEAIVGMMRCQFSSWKSINLSTAPMRSLYMPVVFQKNKCIY